MSQWQRPGWIWWGRRTSEEQSMLDVVEIKPFSPDWDGLDMSRGGTVNIWVEGGWDWNLQTGGLQGHQTGLVLKHLLQKVIMSKTLTAQHFTAATLLLGPLISKCWPQVAVQTLAFTLIDGPSLDLLCPQTGKWCPSCHALTEAVVTFLLQKWC